MKKTFITYLPAVGKKLFNNQKNNNEYSAQEKIQTLPVNKIYTTQCAECLKKAGLDQTCLDNFTINCRNTALQYCEDCFDACPNLCNEDSGGGMPPTSNIISITPEIVNYSSYDANLKTYPISANLAELTDFGPVNTGTNIINPDSTYIIPGNDPCGAFDPAPFNDKCLECLRQNDLIRSSSCGCEDYYTEDCENQILKNRELISSLCCEECKDSNGNPETLKYNTGNIVSSSCTENSTKNDAYSFVTQYGTKVLQSQTAQTNPYDSVGYNIELKSNIGGADTGGGGGDGGGDNGSGNNTCPDGCKQALFYPRGVPGTSPFYIMYRHTNCSPIWYPPEFAFGNDPNITQCKGFISRNAPNLGHGARPESCHPEYASYDPYLGSGDPLGWDSVCASPDRGRWPGIPCYCRKMPHIKSGIYDTLYKLDNINPYAGQFGYISYLDVFSLPMSYTEAGCCICSNTNSKGQPDVIPGQNLTDLYNLNFGQIYSSYTGEMCVEGSSEVTPFVNSNYTETCFEYGISPYLKRIASKDYKAAYDIWTYGGTSKAYQDFGPYYDITSLDQRPSYYDFTMEWSEVTNKQINLRNTLVGFIGLEHHFEAYAYKSENLTAPELGPIQNHCNVLRGPFEKGYAGSFSASEGCSTFTMDAHSKIMWQLYRKTPRRFMYGGGKIPIFHFDLYYFEYISKQKNITIQGEKFSAKKFLSHYYNYFYTVYRGYTSDTSACNNDQPSKLVYEPISLFAELQDGFTYVKQSIIEMIKNKVIGIKDHASDLADDVNSIISSASYTTDEQGNRVLKLNPYVSGLVGDVSGYMDLINFFGVQPITGRVTSKQIKKLLINPLNRNNAGTVERYDPNISSPDAQSFIRFPRKAFLPPYIKGGNLVGWGCNLVTDKDGNITNQSGKAEDYPCLQYSYPSQNIPDEGYSSAPWTKSRYIKVFSGMHTNFWLTDTGQILGSGYRGYDNQFSIPNSINIPYDEYLLKLADDAREPYGKVQHVSVKSTTLAVALANFSSGVNYQDPPGNINDEYSLSNDGNTRQSIPPQPPPQRSKLIAFGSNKNNGIFLSTKGFPRNNTNSWIDVASGMNHTAAIYQSDEKTGVVDQDYKIYTRLYTTGDNSYNQSIFDTPGTVEYTVAKPGYFTDSEWDDYIKDTNSLICYHQDDTKNDIRCKLFSDYNESDSGYIKPGWSMAGAGQYHTIGIQTDGQVRVYGKYFRINSDGNQDNNDYYTHEPCPLVDVFVPSEVKSIAAQWSLQFAENGVINPTTGNPEIICKKAIATTPSTTIKFVDGGPDYSMVATADNTVYIWGRIEMIPGMVPVDIDSDPQRKMMGATGSYLFTAPGEIISISAGANSWVVNYKVPNESTTTDSFITSFQQNNTITHVRKHVYDVNNKNIYDYGFTPTDKEDKSAFGYKWIAAGYSHEVAITYGDIEFPKWDYSLFDLEETRNNQLTGNEKSLPYFFKSYAFFRAVPGGWDFSKWMYGAGCQQPIDPRVPLGMNTCETMDKCSILGEPNTESPTGSGLDKPTWSYSGHPEYWWMIKTARRFMFGAGGSYIQPVDQCENADNLFCGDSQAAAEETANGMVNSCAFGYEPCWQVDGNPITSTPGPHTDDTDCSNKTCEHLCDDPDLSDGSLIKHCLPDLGISRRCTSATGRAGFRSTRDYFLQSYKVFGLKDNCCSVVQTYLSYANYALRTTAFAPNEDGMWVPQINPDPYRTGFASNTIKQSVGASVSLEKNIQYPYIYVGGAALKRLEWSYYAARYGYGDGRVSCGSQTYGCPYMPSTAGPKILGPGGWFLEFGPIEGNNNPDTMAIYSGDQGVEYKQGIYSYNRDAELTKPFNILSNGFGHETGSTYTFCVPNAWSDGNSGWVPRGNGKYQKLPNKGNVLGVTYCYERNLVVFEADNEKNYAIASDETSPTLWHKINEPYVTLFKDNPKQTTFEIDFLNTVYDGSYKLSNTELPAAGSVVTRFGAGSTGSMLFSTATNTKVLSPNDIRFDSGTFNYTVYAKLGNVPDEGSSTTLYAILYIVNESGRKTLRHVTSKSIPVTEKFQAFNFSGTSVNEYFKSTDRFLIEYYMEQNKIVNSNTLIVYSGGEIEGGPIYSTVVTPKYYTNNLEAPCFGGGFKEHNCSNGNVYIVKTYNDKTKQYDYVVQTADIFCPDICTGKCT